MKQFEIAGIPVEINNGQMKVYAFDRKFKSQFEEKLFCFRLCHYCENEEIIDGKGTNVVLVKNDK